jgi:hypothetical protein
MRLKQYIAEIKSTKYEIQYQETSNFIRAYIQIENETFILNIGKEEYSKAMLEYRFNINLNTSESVSYWDINFTDSLGRETLQPKGKGIALKLFAALENEIAKLVKKHKPKIFRFRVSDPTESRFRLYSTIAKKIQKQGNYKLYTHGKQFWFISKEYII